MAILPPKIDLTDSERQTLETLGDLIAVHDEGGRGRNYHIDDVPLSEADVRKIESALNALYSDALFQEKVFFC